MNRKKSEQKRPDNNLVEKPKDFKGTIKKLLTVVNAFKATIVVAIVFTIINASMNIISPKILGGITNQVVDDFIAMRIYDSVMENLPSGVSLPQGTTIDKLPEILIGAGIDPSILVPNDSESAGLMDQIPEGQREMIMSLDLSVRPVIDFAAITRIAIWLIAIYIVGASCNYASGFILAGVSGKITLKLRRELSEKINRLPIGYFDRNQFGDVLSRITNDVDTIGQTLNQSVSQILSSVTMIIGILAMMLTISWQMTLIALTVLPISFGLVSVITKNSQKYFKSQQGKLGEINGYIEETYTGHMIVKAFSNEGKSTEKFVKINESLYRNSWKAQFISGLLFPIMHFVSNLGYVATVVMGGWLAIKGRVSIGNIQAFIQYVNQFNQPVVQLGQIASVVQSTVAAAERVFEFLEEDEETSDLVDAISVKKIRGEIKFENVEFGYSKEKKIIKNFSTHIEPGQKVAIVGPTGAGKTTVVNLLMRFYDPNSGVISIDGVDTKMMRRADVRKQFGMVLQETWLFNGTIYDNLVYGDLNADEKKVRQAAKAAHIDHFVNSLPHGYKTLVNEDSDSISAGEKQLLTIARAMLADSPMMILDEATSSVDTRTEQLIQSAMERLTSGRTSFIIAHRLSTIRDADLILVMKEGNIVEQGTHSELIEKNGFYAELYNSQFVEE